MWYEYTPFVFVHCSPWVIAQSLFRSTLAYHCITILNTLRLSRSCGVFSPLHNIFRRISSSFSHKHRIMLSSSFRIAPAPSSEPDVLPVSFRIACFAKLLFGSAPRYMYKFPPYPTPPPSNASTAFDGTW